MLMEKNRINIKSVNEMNKTPLYYASLNRKMKFGWQPEVGNLLTYDHILYGDNKSK